MDFLRLRRHKIIEVLKQSLPGNISKSLNVLTVSDSVLFSWDFNSHCVLTLNIKATINNNQLETIICQKLLPICPPVFSPEKVVANENNTLLIVAGKNGVLVFHLPKRCPPFGAFSNNKELVYCRTHSLDERLLVCNEKVDMLQIRFHPGSLYNNHILLLTSDNTLRLYKIEDEVVRLGVYPVGDKPSATLPGSKMTFLGALGETAIDFDFGNPEDNPNKPVKLKDPFSTSVKKPEKVVESGIFIYHDKKDEKLEKLKEREDYELFNWPVYVLSGDFVVTCIYIPLYETTDIIEAYPIPVVPSEMLKYDRKACSILCLDSSPQVVCIGSTNGEILHGLILHNEKNELIPVKMENEEKELPKPEGDREIYLFEAVDIELGLTTTTTAQEEGYTCAIFLHKDTARNERYYATHSAGVHCISIVCMEELQNESSEMLTDDVFTIPSTSEYLICTKTSTSKTFNPVVGFAPFYNPNSIVTMLANGNLLSLGITTPTTAEKNRKTNVGNETSKELSKLPFFHYIQSLLKKETHPIIKLSSGEHSLKECHELIQTTSQVFKEKFKQHMTAKEQIERRYMALKIFTEYQITTLKSMTEEKQTLKEAAENLAEKYEDTRDKQEILLKRTAKLLIMLAMKREVLSEAEQDYLDQLAELRKKLDECDSAIEKLITKKSYQETQIRNWKNQHMKKNAFINDTHRDTIKDTLVSTSTKINGMVDEINGFKKLLNLN